jgi:hypothetical protein
MKKEQKVSSKIESAIRSASEKLKDRTIPSAVRAALEKAIIKLNFSLKEVSLAESYFAKQVGSGSKKLSSIKEKEKLKSNEKEIKEAESLIEAGPKTDK